MRSLIPLSLIGLTCAVGMAQSTVILSPPGWMRSDWRPVLVLRLAELDLTQPTSTGAKGQVPSGKRKLPGATVEVVGRYEKPLDYFMFEVLPRLNVQFQQAFQAGYASRESVQLLSQFMFSEPGRFIARPADFWYNGTAPEAVRWEGMWGVDQGTVKVYAGPMGSTKTQTLANRGSNR